MLATDIRSDQVVLNATTESLIQTRLSEAEAASLRDEAALEQQRLEALYNVCSVIHSERGDLTKILSAGADAILEVCLASRCVILMLDEATREPRVVLARTQAGPARRECEVVVSRTIVDETINGQQSLLSMDAMFDPRFKRGDSIAVQNIRSVMTVPMRSEGDVIGVIYADSSTKARAFNEFDLRLLTAIGKQLGVAIERATLITDLEHLLIGSVRALVATIEAKDQYTHGHSERVTNFALAIAQQMLVDEETLAVIELGGLLHDVGKIGVPEAILNKEGKLDDEEFAAIQRHAEQGGCIVSNIENINRLVNAGQVTKAVRHHHERFDGKGYPSQLAGEDIPLAARILAIADTYDAITSDRSYRKGREGHVAAKIIEKCNGTQFDPYCVAAFLRAFNAGIIEKAAVWKNRFHRASRTAERKAA